MEYLNFVDLAVGY